MLACYADNAAPACPDVRTRLPALAPARPAAPAPCSPLHTLPPCQPHHHRTARPPPPAALTSDGGSRSSGVPHRLPCRAPLAMPCRAPRTSLAPPCRAPLAPPCPARGAARPAAPCPAGHAARRPAGRAARCPVRQGAARPCSPCRRPPCLPRRRPPSSPALATSRGEREVGGGLGAGVRGCVLFVGGWGCVCGGCGVWGGWGRGAGLVVGGACGVCGPDHGAVWCACGADLAMSSIRGLAFSLPSAFLFTDDKELFLPSINKNTDGKDFAVCIFIYRRQSELFSVYK